MRSNTSRVVLGIAAVAVAVILLLVLRDDGGDDSGGVSTVATTPAPDTTNGKPAPKPKPAKPQVPEIVVRGGAPVGGVQDLTFDAGETIRFDVSSDEADEIHVHGYDVEEEVPAGGTAHFSFPAEIEGLFEVELHHSEAQIAELRVEP